MKALSFGPKQLFYTYVAVMLLALLTWGLAQVQSWPYWLHDWIAFLIAITKAGLVVAIFMELAHGRKLLKFWALIAVVFLFIMGSIIGDYVTRPWDTRPASWESNETVKIVGNRDNGGSPTPTPENGESFPKSK